MRKLKKRCAVLLISLSFVSAAFCACSAQDSANRTAETQEASAAQTAEAAEDSGTRADGTLSGDWKAAASQDAGPVQDGTYEPAFFTAEGGTGKVQITCPEVTVADGAAQALIEFSSPHYDWVKVDGAQYDPENADKEDRENSVFRIPVRLDEKMTISGLTTAMSEPHEIEYTILVSLTENGAAETKTEGGAADTKIDSGAAQAGTEKAAEGTEAKKAAAESEGETEESAEELEELEMAGGKAGGKTSPDAGADTAPPELPGLTYVSAMDTAYAEAFDIYTYRAEDSGAEYRLIDVHNSGQYLLLPQQDADQNAGKKGKETTGKKTSGQKIAAGQDAILKSLPAGITVLQAPLDNLYVAATSSMALFDAAGALDQVKLTGTKEDGWYIDGPREALKNGSMVYAGKYSAPDYELLASSGCDLAVESMMILHTPEVKEKLEELGIPVFIDTSSTESHPLGRTEWVRLYGVLTGHEKEADAFFEDQKKQFDEAKSYTDTGARVAFFSISSNGNVIVRATDDYIPRMIELAGGDYAFRDLLNESGNSASVRLSMEDFYSTAGDADYLIYNATIESPVSSIKDLCGRSSLLADFKAVQDGHVWQVKKSLYQSPDIAAQMITDIHRMLTDEDPAGMVFLEKVK